MPCVGARSDYAASRGLMANPETTDSSLIASTDIAENQRPLVCVALLVSAPREQVRAHVAYHLARGIDHVYVGFDAGSDADLACLGGDARVTGVACAEPFWRAHGVRQSTRIQLRQVAFMRHARRLAAERGLDWLIHIDVDELLHFEGNALRHALAAATTDVVTFKAWELIPPATGATRDCAFAEGRYFRAPAASGAGSPRSGLYAGSFFRGYDGGKSATRVLGAADTIEIHRPTQHGLRLPTTQCATVSVLHFESLGFHDWRHGWRRRAGDSELAWVSRGEHRRAIFRAFQRAAGSERAERRLYQRLYHVPQARLAKWMRAGAVREVTLDPDLFRWPAAGARCHSRPVPHAQTAAPRILADGGIQKPEQRLRRRAVQQLLAAVDLDAEGFVGLGDAPPRAESAPTRPIFFGVELPTPSPAWRAVLRRALFIGAQHPRDVATWRAYAPELSIELVGDPISGLFELSRPRGAPSNTRHQLALRNWQLRTRRRPPDDVARLKAAAGRLRIAIEGRPHLAAHEPDGRIEPLTGPVFIVGPPRSGTTMLASLIASSGVIAIAPETHLLLRGWTFEPPQPRPRLAFFDSVWFKGLGDDRERVLDDIRSRVPNRSPNRADVFESVIRRYAQRANAPRFGEKTPQHWQAVEDLLTRFPDARILWTHRDPRAHYASLKKVDWAANEPILHMRRWLAALRGWHTWRHDPRVLGIRYEDLVLTPHAMNRAIERHLGATLRLQHDEERAPRPIVEKGQSKWANAHRAASRAPVHSRSVWRWCDELSADEVRLIEALTFRGMDELGYLRHFELLGAEHRAWAAALTIGTAIKDRTPQRYVQRLRRIARKLGV